MFSDVILAPPNCGPRLCMAALSHQTAPCAPAHGPLSFHNRISRQLDVLEVEVPHLPSFSCPPPPHPEELHCGLAGQFCFPHALSCCTGSSFIRVHCGDCYPPVPDLLSESRTVLLGNAQFSQRIGGRLALAASPCKRLGCEGT